VTGAAAPAEPLLRLRPLGLGEILDDVFRVYRRHFWLLVAIALIVSLPGLALQFASGSASQFGFALSILNDLNNPDALAARQPPALPNLALLALSYLVLIALVPFMVAAIPRATIDIVLGNPVSVRSTLAGVARRYWRLMGVALLYVLISPMVLCLPVFVWLFVRWVVAVPALLTEDIGPVRALDRSWTLTRGHWWRLFGILVLIYLLTTVVSGALGVFALPVAVAVPFIPPFVRGAIILTVETAASAVVQPALYLCVTLLYFDLRIRHEHFDLDQLARLAVAPGP
jgi:membrane-anchored glycerophosphoryl diester phosphodiesterase (GDPDase)